jgi:hypothetical protein
MLLATKTQDLLKTSRNQAIYATSRSRSSDKGLVLEEVTTDSRPMTSHEAHQISKPGKQSVKNLPKKKIFVSNFASEM